MQLHMSQLLYYIGLLALLGCSPVGSGEPASNINPDMVYTMSREPATFDPHLTESLEAGIVLRQVYDTLIYRDPATREFVPGLAMDWSISEDQLSYTFRLRDGVTFHDGTRFDANAVASNLDRIVNLQGRAFRSLGPYRGYEIVDSHTIIIRLAEPYSPLLDALSHFYLGMASPLALAEYSTQRYQFYQVGTGPYRFKDLIPGRYVILEKNDTYNWPPTTFAGDFENAPGRVEFRFLDDDSRAIDVVTEGQSAVVEQLSPAGARSLAVSADIQVLPTGIPGQPIQMLMNVEQAPTDELPVRQALLHATNRSEIADGVFGGFSPVAWGPLSANTLYYSQEMTGIYPYDIVAAGELLESAGYTDDDNDGFLEREGEPLVMELIVPSNPVFTQLVELLRRQWQIVGIGIEVDVRPTERAIAERITEGNYNLVAHGSLGIDPHLLTDYYTSSGLLNWTGYTDDSLDEVLLRASQDNDPIVRASAYVQAQRFIMQEALVLPLVEVVHLNAARTTVGGLSYDAQGVYPILPNVRLTSDVE